MDVSRETHKFQNLGEMTLERHASDRSGLTLLHSQGKFFRTTGPIVERCRIKIGAIRPYQSMDFGIDPHLIEQGYILQWPEKVAKQHWRKIDALLGGVFKSHQ
jgi:hypothetical protein